jgi:hypothetical protein
MLSVSELIVSKDRTIYLWRTEKELERSGSDTIQNFPEGTEEIY